MQVKKLYAHVKLDTASYLY